MNFLLELRASFSWPRLWSGCVLEKRDRERGCVDEEERLKERSFSRADTVKRTGQWILFIFCGLPLVCEVGLRVKLLVIWLLVVICFTDCGVVASSTSHRQKTNHANRRWCVLKLRQPIANRRWCVLKLRQPIEIPFLPGSPRHHAMPRHNFC